MTWDDFQTQKAAALSHSTNETHAVVLMLGLIADLLWDTQQGVLDDIRDYLRISARD